MYNQQQNMFNQGAGTGYAYNNKKVEMHQALTPEEEASLRQRSKTNISFKLDQDEVLLGICTHKSNATKLPDLTHLGGNRFRCNICREEFELIDDPELFKQAISIVISGLQTIKTWWYDIPQETAREYFPIIPLLKKAPIAYNMARQCWRAYEEAKEVNTMGNQSAFNMWNQMNTGMYAPQQGVYGQPQYAPQQPMYGQPQYAPQGFDQQQYYNPVQPQYGCQPQEANPFVNQGQQQPSFAPNNVGYAPGAGVGNGVPIGNESTTVQNTLVVKKAMEV